VGRRILNWDNAHNKVMKIFRYIVRTKKNIKQLILVADSLQQAKDYMLAQLSLGDVKEVIHFTEEFKSASTIICLGAQQTEEKRENY
jgi:archaellum biogenesis ATPase FlaH